MLNGSSNLQTLVVRDMDKKKFYEFSLVPLEKRVNFNLIPVRRDIAKIKGFLEKQGQVIRLFIGSAQIFKSQPGVPSGLVAFGS